MKTIIVNVPDKDETFILSLLKKFKLKTQVLTDEDMEDEALAEWIKNGLKSDEVSKEQIVETLRKRGVKI